MTRNERIRDHVDAIRRKIIHNRRWVSVSVAQGHTCSAPFVTLDPLDAHEIEVALTAIHAELEPKR